MLPGERRLEILELLRQNRAISVVDLSRDLASSVATIRRDLTILEKEGKLERTHGGALVGNDEGLVGDESFYMKESVNAAEKAAIAKVAMTMLSDGDSIILDAGSTTQALAKRIGRSDLRLTVVTNSATNIQLLIRNPNITLILLGGQVRLNTLATVGRSAIEALSGLNVRMTFVGVNGLSPTQGLMTPDPEEGDIKTAMIAAGRHCIVLADHSKFRKQAMCRFAPIEKVDTIVTGKKTDSSTMDAYRKAGVRVLEA